MGFRVRFRFRVRVRVRVSAFHPGLWLPATSSPYLVRVRVGVRG